jgi:putative endonuclease
VNQSKREVGQSGEDYAAQHLIQAGLTLLQRNYRCPQGEMDIIAREGLQLVFVEVRTRTSGRYGWGEESITPQKKARLTRIASHYIKSQGYKEWPILRFDLIAIKAGRDSENRDLYWIRGI